MWHKGKGKCGIKEVAFSAELRIENMRDADKEYWAGECEVYLEVGDRKYGDLLG
jgi:hypothetical protein